MGDTRHLHLDWNCDVALDLFGRLPRALGDDIDERRHWVGISFDVELDETDNTGTDDEEQHNDYQNPLL